MYLTYRPSKTYFFRKVKKYIAYCEPFNSVVDCASANAKFRILFPGKKYCGIDVDSNIISENIKRFKNNEDLSFFCDDMLDLKSEVKDKKFDLAISTHTLIHVKQELRSKCIANLSSLVNSNGSMIINSSISDIAIVDSFRDDYKEVMILKSRRSISRKIEPFVLRFVKTQNVFVKRSILILMWLLSFIDIFGSPDQILVLFYQKIKQERINRVK
jgi:ubiquinone/menaquinone biosynthesis C-methylase UbiE